MCEIRGIGMDLCAISRMAPTLTKPHFLQRVFTPQELDYVHSKGEAAAASLAAIWAAKEAALKAFGVGIALPMTDVEVVHLPSGQPVYVLHGKAAEAAAEGRLVLSLTHEGDYAAAVCLWFASI